MQLKGPKQGPLEGIIQNEFGDIDEFNLTVKCKC